MTFWKDKQGNKLTFKQFIQRWKQGLTKIDALQQVKIQINSTIIMIIGILAGVFISIINIKTLWWLLIILVGALGNTSVSLLGLWQKKKLLKQFDVKLEEIKNE